MANKRKKIKKGNTIQLIIGLLIIIVINIISAYIYTRLDLTSEKRYTLSKATKGFIKKIDDVVLFKVYLDGDFPAGFKKLKAETKEMLDEFRAYNNNIEYKFINPSEGADKTKTKGLYKQLIDKGLEPTNLQVKTNDGSSQQIIFPGAVVSYKGKDLPLQLLISQKGTPPEQVLNNSIQGLEYNIANVIRKLITKEKPKIGYVIGNGELDLMRVADLVTTLSDFYSTDTVKINHKINALNERFITKQGFHKKYDAIIIAKPEIPFDEKDKFLIDQYIMHGGKVIWLISPVVASLDSLMNSPQTLAFSRRLNLDDMFFNYGIRMNNDLLLDINSLPIPVVTGQIGDQPQISFMPCYYFPVITPTSDNPIVKNLNAIKCEFPSSIDTVGNNTNLKKTVLLATSKYSRKINAPASISLEIMQHKPNIKSFNKSNIPLAILVEGIFTSNFKDRVPSEIAEDKASFDYKEVSPNTSMIFIADGDIAKNQLHRTQGYPLPLGYDQYTNQYFGNKDLMLNCVDYLCDESGLIAVRSRELKLRMLDKTKIEKYKLSIQLINVVLPILLILVFGIILNFFRKRKYD